MRRSGWMPSSRRTRMFGGWKRWRCNTVLQPPARASRCRVAARTGSSRARSGPSLVRHRVPSHRTTGLGRAECAEPAMQPVVHQAIARTRLPQPECSVFVPNGKCAGRAFCRAVIRDEGVRLKTTGAAAALRARGSCSRPSGSRLGTRCTVPLPRSSWRKKVGGTRCRAHIPALAFGSLGCKGDGEFSTECDKPLR